MYSPRYIKTTEPVLAIANFLLVSSRSCDLHDKLRSGIRLTEDEAEELSALNELERIVAEAAGV